MFSGISKGDCWFKTAEGAPEERDGITSGIVSRGEDEANAGKNAGKESKIDKKADKKALQQTMLVNVPAEHLEGLWQAVTQLASLEKLTMDRDHLREVRDIGKLLSLKTLSLANNKLAAVPEDICMIRGLKHLVLSGNQLRELTTAVGELEQLERLDVRSNQLRLSILNLA